MDIRWRVTKMVALATNAPTKVPIAAQTASPNKAKAQKPRNVTSGQPTNTGAVRSIEVANGQIRRGRGRDTTADKTQAANATTAAKGNTKITEKSMAESYQGVCLLATTKRPPELFSGQFDC